MGGPWRLHHVTPCLGLMSSRTSLFWGPQVGFASKPQLQNLPSLPWQGVWQDPPFSCIVGKASISKNPQRIFLRRRLSNQTPSLGRRNTSDFMVTKFHFWSDPGFEARAVLSQILLAYALHFYPHPQPIYLNLTPSFSSLPI